MTEEKLEYHADGLAMSGRLFHPIRGGRSAAVLVFPDLFGIGEHSVERARMLAEMGYVALACDLHGGGRTIGDFASAMAELNSLVTRPTRLRARAEGAFAALAEHPSVDADRIAAIGFCFGGTIALELARAGAALRATVGFHCNLSTSEPLVQGRGITGRVLMCIGADDPLITCDERMSFEREMRSVDTSWEMHLFGGVVHNFTNRRSAQMNMPESVRYDEYADRHSWSLMASLLAEVFEREPVATDPGVPPKGA